MKKKVKKALRQYVERYPTWGEIHDRVPGLVFDPIPSPDQLLWTIYGGTIIMPTEHTIHIIKAMRVKISELIRDEKALLTLIDRGIGGREVATSRLKLQEAKHWLGEALGELGQKLPEEFRDEAKGD